MNTIGVEDLRNFILFTKKVLGVLEFANEAVLKLEQVRNREVITVKGDSFEDFLHFAHHVGSREVADLLTRCEVIRWTPAVPRFKFRGPPWECGMLDHPGPYAAELRDLLTRFCDGREPRYTVFVRNDSEVF